MISPGENLSLLDSLEYRAFQKLETIRTTFNNTPNDRLDSYIELDIELDNPDIYTYIKVLSDLLCEGVAKETDDIICYNAFCFAYNVGKQILGTEIELGNMGYLLDGDRRTLQESLLEDVEQFLSSHSVLREIIDEDLLSMNQPSDTDMLSRATAAITFMHIENQYARTLFISEFERQKMSDHGQ